MTTPAGNTGVYGFIILFLFLLPAVIDAQSDHDERLAPPVAQQLVREGAFAVRLHSSLGLGTSDNEPDAESRLGESGISPRNGWIADYPVTPDIIGELRESLISAANAGRTGLNKDAALQVFDDAAADYALSVKPRAVSESGKASAAEAGNHPVPAEINKFYSTMGPPVITYYNPPSGYAHLYCLVPYPFKSHGTSFPGFFILKMFHRTVFVKQRVEFVTNRFHVYRNHREFRIDPLARFNGKSFAGIGAADGTGFKKTGIRGSERKVFNSPQPWVKPIVGEGSSCRRGHGVFPGRVGKR
jgi:hypothetical protein